MGFFLLGGGQRIQNIQPFSKRDLEIRSLGDRIRDIQEIMYLYPEKAKHDVFQKFYSGIALHNAPCARVRIMFLYLGCLFVRLRFYLLSLV